MCGDYLSNAPYLPFIVGSPLHVRGLPVADLIINNKLGITPACAGTTKTIDK